MKKGFYFFLLLFHFSVVAQVVIDGKVVSEKNTPLEGASVYLNNTMVGTITNSKGEFSFETKKGQFELIISFLGFKKVIYFLNTSKQKESLFFKLIEQENILDEVFLKKTKYDNEWKHNLDVFKREFIGMTELAKNCKILNPKALHFEFDRQKNTLTAYAKEPLKIKHKGLGYLITYELESFVRGKNYVTYLGYSRYENLKENKRKQKKWKAERLKTYNGSPVHFFKSVINNTFIDQGFVVNQFKRIPNAERPTEEQIKKARELIRLHKKSINFSTKITQPKNAIDSAMVTLKKVRLPKFKDFLYKSKLNQKEIINTTNNAYHLSFENNLSIIYNKEKEEEGYLTRGIFSRKRKALDLQTSSLIQQNRNSIIDKSGVLINPLDVFYEGYWSYEKFANSLPQDYQPLED